MRSWIHTAPGHRAQIECIVYADPPAAVTWLKGEALVIKDSRVVSLVSGEKHTLLIRNVLATDIGVYTCRARNDLGAGEVHIELSGKSTYSKRRIRKVSSINKKSSGRCFTQCNFYMKHHTLKYFSIYFPLKCSKEMHNQFFYILFIETLFIDRSHIYKALFTL